MVSAMSWKRATSAGSADDLQLELDTGDGRSAEIVSRSADVPDWIHVRVPAGSTLRATVDLAGVWEVDAA